MKRKNRKRGSVQRNNTRVKTKRIEIGLNQKKV